MKTRCSFVSRNGIVDIHRESLAIAHAGSGSPEPPAYHPEGDRSSLAHERRLRKLGSAVPKFEVRDEAGSAGHWPTWATAATSHSETMCGRSAKNGTSRPSA